MTDVTIDLRQLSKNDACDQVRAIYRQKRAARYSASVVSATLGVTGYYEAECPETMILVGPWGADREDAKKEDSMTVKEALDAAAAREARRPAAPVWEVSFLKISSLRQRSYAMLKLASEYEETWDYQIADDAIDEVVSALGLQYGAATGPLFVGEESPIWPLLDSLRKRGLARVIP